MCKRVLLMNADMRATIERGNPGEFRVGSYKISALHARALRWKYPNQAPEPTAKPVIGVKISNKLIIERTTTSGQSPGIFKKGWDGEK